MKWCRAPIASLNLLCRFCILCRFKWRRGWKHPRATSGWPLYNKWGHAFFFFPFPFLSIWKYSSFKKITLGRESLTDLPGCFEQDSGFNSNLEFFSPSMKNAGWLICQNIFCFFLGLSHGTLTSCVICHMLNTCQVLVWLNMKTNFVS